METLEYFITEYGYLAIFIGTLLEGETILVLGGIAAQQGFLNLYLVMMCAFFGSYTGDQCAFAIGRRWGTQVLARKPAWQAKADYLLNKSPTFLNIWMVIFRFFYGLRNPTPWVLGSSRIVSFKKFLLLNGIGACLWAIAVSYGGYAFGMLIDRVMGQMRTVILSVLAVLAVLIPLGIWIYRKRKRKIEVRAAEPALTRDESWEKDPDR
jgi:membrane protein DedA with SNARE-associated domain